MQVICDVCYFRNEFYWHFYDFLQHIKKIFPMETLSHQRWKKRGEVMTRLCDVNENHVHKTYAISWAKKGWEI